LMIVAGQKVCSVCLTHLDQDNVCPKHGPRTKPINDAQTMHHNPGPGYAHAGSGGSKAGRKRKKQKRQQPWWAKDFTGI